VIQVLICEDDATTRVLLKHMLGKAIQCQVEECKNGVEALALLRQKRFDLLLLDLMMPVMGGYEALRWIRSTAGLQDLQVIVLSGENDGQLVRQVIGLGVLDFLLKPVAEAKTKVRLLGALAKLKLNPRMQLPSGGATLPPADSEPTLDVPDAAASPD
jgi:CheY-like chemotaxis protein